MSSQTNASASLVPLSDDKKPYQIVKQTTIPMQLFIDEDIVLSTLAIPFVFVQERTCQPTHEADNPN